MHISSFHFYQIRRPLLAVMLPLLLAGCAAGPDYARPAVALPEAFRHQDGWQATASLPVAVTTDTAWWTPFQDEILSDLMREVAAANPTLEQAEAQWRQARALVGSARAAAMPVAGATLGGTRSGGNARPTTRLYEAGLNLSWAPDIWGRTSREREAAEEGALAAGALHGAARLALQLEAAQGYVRLRALDHHVTLVAQALRAYERSLQLTRHQYEAGLVARADVIQAETQLQSLRTQAMSVARQRTLQEHALATLAGSTPAGWRVPVSDIALPTVPAVPVAIPSALLIQRPDIAAAERQLSAANARVGVAASAWLPTLTLGASGDWQSGSWKNLWDAPTRLWSLGPSIAAALFDGGARRAAREQAEAQYDAQAAAWRATVLQGIRETEDALVSLSSLTAQDEQQQRLVALATENERVVTQRYEAGEISFLEVATAQNLALESRRNALDVQADRLTASMQLIAALGGGWTMPEP